MINLEETFAKFECDYLKFELVESPLHRRPDIAAFLLLDKLVDDAVTPNGYRRDIIGGAKHDEIWLDVDANKLAEVATEADILTLVRCGVRFYDDALCMFV